MVPCAKDCSRPVELALSYLYQNRQYSYCIIMSIDSRYQAFLCDLLALFQELTLRIIDKKQVDLDKFKHYFNQFYDRMRALEDSFHEQKLKITKYLKKLKEKCSPNPKSSRSFDGLKSNHVDNTLNKPIPQPFVRSISTAKPSQASKQLKSIEEEDEQIRTPINNRRSETAGGIRKRVFSGTSRGHSRPKTGKAGGAARYMDSEKISRTINRADEFFLNTEQSRSNKQFSRSRQRNRIQFALEDNEVQHKKNDFYAELQKQKEKEGETISSKECQQLFRKYQVKANKRIWGKINRLL